MTARLTLLFSILFFPFITIAQTHTITGHVADAKDTSSLPGVTVILTNTADTNNKTGSTTDANGNFGIDNVKPGNYSLRLDYVGYKSFYRRITIADKDFTAGTIAMKTLSNELKGVTVTGKQIRAEQTGDTSQFHADAYKTHPDATAEDLITKMPGVTSDNTGVKVNGESVQQVYVDGKPFFGTDPSLAVKNLPAEVIDKIQVFDKLSDQATFTGFDDGNSQKTMNIVTKRNKSEGTFGKVYAGYGTDDRYIAGGSLNIFNGDQRITILGLSNNINQQNFSAQDVLGISGGSGQNRGGGGGGRGNFGGGSSASNFFVGQQGGITNTNSFGLNYSDSWGKKIKVSGSYFFNNTDNTTNTELVRNYFTSADSTNVYHENDNNEAKNFNHRFNLRFEYTIDSFNSIIFTPGVSFQQNNTTGYTIANDSIAQLPPRLTNNNSNANNNGYSSSDNLLIQHKFKKPRRTISFNINTSLNEKTGNGSYYSNDVLNTDTTIRDQHNTLYNNSNTVSSSISYTEPVGKKGQLMFNYSPSVAKSKADKETYDKGVATQQYDSLDAQFSNKYNNTYTTQKGGLSYRVGDKKMSFNIGTNVQYATLNGSQQFPNTFSLEKSFPSVLPSAFFNYRFADGRNLRIMYRTNTQAPSITQLQDVVDITNPILLKTGNAALKQDYEQTFILRYGLTKAKTAHNFFLNLYATYINDYIGNATYSSMIRDTTFIDPLTSTATFIKKSSQLTRPVNLDGYVNMRSFITYGLPAEFIKCNLNLNGGFNFTRTPGIVNNMLNFTNNYIPSFGMVLSSNVSEKLDFTLSYSGNYNIVNNTTQSKANNNYYNHTASFKINYIFKERLVINTNIAESYYTAFSSTGNQDFYLWNAYLAYKFLKNKALEARISAYDILNQNKSISRTVTETYIENNVTQVLQQYFIFQLTYTIRNFKGAMPTLQQGEDNSRPWRDHVH